MPDIDRSVVLEALSVLTGTEVKLFTEYEEGFATPSELTIENFLSTVYGKEHKPCEEVSLITFFKNLFLGSKDEEPETGASSLRKELFVDLDEFLDPRYDYDFTDGSDSSRCSRGGEPYSRPWGWYRFALNVLDKYPDGNAWLGSEGWRSHSSPGEWPVSFHGTSIDGARGIARSHFTAGAGQVHGRGIYSTPNIKVALGYTFNKMFKSSTTGKTYSVIMQNRINPGTRVITAVKDYWLIPVPEETSAAEEKRIVEESIRPYGILIKEMES